MCLPFGLIIMLGHTSKIFGINESKNLDNLIQLKK